ncbi:MAG: HlyD family efflux transporter periplasmic adaptor subunit [Hyphomicrobium sp.]|nr:HlyD family efflux transporter periplasmic adaptor subunit [Hyphomicrobium sp.]
MSTELKASRLVWTKLRRILITTAIVGGVGGSAIYALSGSSVLLNADGLATRRNVAVASPWENARVRAVYVNPGDWVDAGQKIAVVESAAMSRSLADLAAEKARISSRLAQLEARKGVVKALLPMAEANATQTEAFLEVLQKASANGNVTSKPLQEMMTARVQAADRLLSLKAEQGSLEHEIKSNQDALGQVSGAFQDLERNYGGGILTAPASGYVGSRVAAVGEVLGGGKDGVASIYTGASYVLAYIPEGYLFDLEEGQKVNVKGRGQVVAGRIEKVLPVTEALPPEFQMPNKVRGRGQAVRVALPASNHFAVDEKVHLTSCYMNKCEMGPSQIVRKAVPDLQKLGARLGGWIKGLKALVVNQSKAPSANV